MEVKHRLCPDDFSRMNGRRSESLDFANPDYYAFDRRDLTRIDFLVQDICFVATEPGIRGPRSMFVGRPDY